MLCILLIIYIKFFHGRNYSLWAINRVKLFQHYEFWLYGSLGFHDSCNRFMIHVLIPFAEKLLNQIGYISFHLLHERRSNAFQNLHGFAHHNVERIIGTLSLVLSIKVSYLKSSKKLKCWDLSQNHNDFWNTKFVPLIMAIWSI